MCVSVCVYVCMSECLHVHSIILYPESVTIHISLVHRDRSSGYCYTKSRRQGSQDFVDEWIPYEKPPLSIPEAHDFRAKQVCCNEDDNYSY